MLRQQTRMEAFLSLSWYETFLRFIANFIAKSSEILLTAGLVVSSANFLSDGSMLREGTPFAIAWAWTQAIAIDGSLGVSFYAVFRSLKQRDWVKFVLYSILTTLLTLVAWFITEGDIFSHAVNASTQESMRLLGIDAKILSTLRAIAVVGFVLMSRLKDDTLQEPVEPAVKEPHQVDHINAPSEKGASASLQTIPAQPLTRTDIEHIIQSMLQQGHYQTTVIEERSDHLSLTSPITGTSDRNSFAPQKEQSEEQNKIDRHKLSQENGLEYEDRLLQAYHELQEEHQKISGRALAQRAHIRRATCTQWLQTYQLKSPITNEI